MVPQQDFHSQQDILKAKAVQQAFGLETEFTYSFENFYHPFVGELLRKLNRESIAGMLDANFHAQLGGEVKNPPNSFFKVFGAFYEKPAGAQLARLEGLPEEIDLRNGGPYANYNWELLFHFPFAIAVHLSTNQRFAEAQRWFHCIFDPTCNDMSIPPPQRFWKFLAFRQPGSPTQIDDLLSLLSKPDGECSPSELASKQSVVDGYKAMMNKPFHPYAIARTRLFTFQFAVFMKYCDNLIAWGDTLLRLDTAESVDEAKQLYVLAANILGARPQRVPRHGTVRPKTFALLKAQGLDPLGNALVELEGQFPFNLGLPQDGSSEATPLFGMGTALYFCIPPNEKLLGYWDIVADRLFKIRHCMNIEGVVRQLALFDPPIDPAMLVKAAAAGIDVGSIVSGLNQPIGPVRAPLLIQKALELCSEVRALGSSLLTAIEKGDAEHLARLRQRHEITINQMTQELRFLQWKHAQESTESLLRGRSLVLERYRHYMRLLGLPPDDKGAPDTLRLNRGTLTEENFDEAFGVLVKQYESAVSAPGYPDLDTKEEGNLHLLEGEYDELNVHADRALVAKTTAAGVEAVTSGLAAIPNINMKMAYWGVGGETELTGGAFLSNIGKAVSSGFAIWAEIEQWQGTFASKKASYIRRADEWILQARLAALELTQIGRQIIGSLIAEQIAYRDYRNIQRQIEQSESIDKYLHEKFNNEELYSWMQGDTSRLYYEYTRYAFDWSRKAERTMKYELMRPELDATDFVKFNYWDAGRRGLLAGEALYLDVKRMEAAYHEHNRREYELTRHVSVRQLAPVALLELQATGSCELTVPEWLFDLDCPGHYMRRIKTVSVTIPCVAGPYTSVNCTLSLLKSSLRQSPALKEDEYARQGSEDDRFVDGFGTVQSIVTSGGTNESGTFESVLRDDRFLHFEGVGAESTWKLELAADFRQFDYQTISDVVLHVRYTAREGGARLRQKATEHLQMLIEDAQTSGLALLLSLRHEFPGDWHRFVTGNTNFATKVKRDYFPYLAHGRDITIDSVRLYAIAGQQVRSTPPPGVDLTALTEALKDEGAFDLSLAPDGDVLVRDKEAAVFLLIRFSLGIS